MDVLYVIDLLKLVVSNKLVVIYYAINRDVILNLISIVLDKTVRCKWIRVQALSKVRPLPVS
jgi:hypothetical protein